MSPWVVFCGHLVHAPSAAAFVWMFAKLQHGFVCLSILCFNICEIKGISLNNDIDFKAFVSLTGHEYRERVKPIENYCLSLMS